MIFFGDFVVKYYCLKNFANKPVEIPLIENWDTTEFRIQIPDTYHLLNHSIFSYFSYARIERVATETNFSFASYI